MAEVFVTSGIACMIAAIIGGGLKAFGVEFPLLASSRRQGALFGLGALLTLVGVRPDRRAAPPPSPPPPDTTPVTPAEFTGEMGPLEAGISYNQGDLYDRPARSPEECVSLCRNDNRCLAVTFIVSQQRCWVKNRVGAVGQSSDMVSSRKLAR